MVLMKYIRANRAAPLYTLLWQAIFFVIGLGMVAFINGFLNEDPTYACMGSFFALIATLIGTLARGNLNGHTRFRLAVSMGSTRRSFLLCNPIITALTGLIGILVAWILYLCEQALYGVFYPGFENDMPLDALFSWLGILLFVAVTVVLDLVMSALMQRFGVKGFLAVWLIGCGVFVLFSHMIGAHTDGSTSILARIGAVILTVVTVVPWQGWIAVGVILVLALLVFSVNTFRKAEIAL